MDDPTPSRLFHGGKPGFNIGDTIDGGHDRPLVDGCVFCKARAASVAIIDPLSAQPDRVYLTESRDYALHYASLYGQGDLYAVTPLGNVERSAEDSFPSWIADAAEVRMVCRRAVTMTWTERRRLARKWDTADKALPHE